MDRVEYQTLVIQDIINLYNADEIDLNPWYQRRSVWSNPQKSYLINTLLEQKPIPSVYMRHYIDLQKEKSIKEIVDGQQRIRAILDYYIDEFATRYPGNGRRVKYSQLSTSQKKKFLMTSLSFGNLIEATDADVIEIFGRLNSVSKTLNSQEKRNAKFSGEYKQFCLHEASERVEFWRTREIFTANSIARMMEVQFIADLVFNMIYELQDFRTTDLDNMYEDNDEDFPERKDIKKRLNDIFNLLASLPVKDLKDTIFSRPPILFSLILILDDLDCDIPKQKLSESLQEINSIYNSDIPVSERPSVDANFYIACTSSTQRVKSRRVRDKYIRRFLA